MAGNDRPKSFASSFTHASQKSGPPPTMYLGPTRAAPPIGGTPSHQLWTAYSGPVLFTGLTILVLILSFL